MNKQYRTMGNIKDKGTRNMKCTKRGKQSSLLKSKNGSQGAQLENHLVYLNTFAF